MIFSTNACDISEFDFIALYQKWTLNALFALCTKVHSVDWIWIRLLRYLTIIALRSVQFGNIAKKPINIDFCHFIFLIERNQNFHQKRGSKYAQMSTIKKFSKRGIENAIKLCKVDWKISIYVYIYIFGFTIHLYGGLIGPFCFSFCFLSTDLFLANFLLFANYYFLFLLNFLFFLLYPFRF